MRRSSLHILLLFPVLALQASAQMVWNPEKAAAYLDQRTAWWIGWPQSARDHGTFCISCHTTGPISLARPSRKVLDNIVKRVRDWREMEPFYPDQTRGLPKTSESRGTESILNALILAWNDAPSGHLSADARLALDNMWALQFKAGEMKGSWAWLQFHNAPWEGDSQFYGTSLAALAVGSAPGDYQQEPGVQESIQLLKAWLVSNMDVQTPLDRAVLLLASGKLKGLLTPVQRNSILEPLLSKQCADGGFTMSNLVGGWKRADGTPIETASDGYATALVALALEQMDTAEAKTALGRALAWLNRNQQADGRWAASSLNKQREISSAAGLFMSDAATAYAVLALTQAAR